MHTAFHGLVASECFWRIHVFLLVSPRGYHCRQKQLALICYRVVGFLSLWYYGTD